MTQKKILTLFGTRPEVIKLAPVLEHLEAAPDTFSTVNVSSGQHDDLLAPFIRFFQVRVDHDLRAMEPKQTPNQVCVRVLSALDPVLREKRPDLILVQGDTTTALAGALAGRLVHADNPFGRGDSGRRIARTIAELLVGSAAPAAPAVPAVRSAP